MTNPPCKYIEKQVVAGSPVRLCKLKQLYTSRSEHEKVDALNRAIEQKGKALTLAAAKDCPFFDSDDFEACPAYVPMS